MNAAGIKGFTLIELAVVLFIIALLLGGLLTPLATQIEGRNRQLTQQSLDEIKEALIGFAIINGRLPCSTTQTDPADANYGEEDSCDPTAVSVDGYIPWKTLGVPAFDQWGGPRSNTTDPWIGHWRYRVDRNFSDNTSPFFDLTTGFQDNLTVQDSLGNALTSTSSEYPVAIVYSTGANKTQDGENATYDTTYQGGTPNATAGFDDMTIWLTRPILFNRMVVARKLPP